MKQQKTEVTSFNFRGIITGTSNKVSSDFINDNPRKACYVKVDQENAKNLEEQGLKNYISKDKEEFFILKLSEVIGIWVNNEKIEMNTDISSPNFLTDFAVNIACLKGKAKGNDYFRIFAIGLKTLADITILEELNPFADDEIPF